MHEVLVNRLGGLSLPRKSVVRLTDRPDMTLDVYRGRKATMQQHHYQRGWSGGAMVLGKLPVPGRPTIWMTVGQGPTALTVVGVVWTFLLSSILSFLFLPLFGRRPDVD